MYNVSDKFKSAIQSTSRLMSCKAYLNGVELSVDKILKLDIEDTVNNGDYFTIGEVPSKLLTIEMLGVGVIEGSEIKPYYGVEISPGEFEYIPCGVFYVDSFTTNKNKVTATCYDKMLNLDDEYIPNIAIPVTLSEIMNDICRQKGIEFEGRLPSITVNKSIKGYSYREMIGFIASFCGGNAKFNRFGKLIIQQYVKSNKIVNADVCSKFEHKDIYTVSAIACKFGDVANTRGDSSANCVNFTNPFVDDTNIDSIFNLLNGLTFTAASFKYTGDPSVDSGDLITINDVKGNSHVVVVSTQDFKFSGGLTSEITSIGEGKGANAYKQYKFKNKKSITELNVELGLIQGIISEVREKQEDTYTKTETETLVEAKAGEVSLSVAKKEVESAKEEIDKTLKNYPTTTEMESAIDLKANEIASTVEEVKTSSSGGGNIIYNGDFTHGMDNWIPEKFSGGDWTYYADGGSSEWIPDGKWALWFNTFNITDLNRIGEHTVRQVFPTVVGQTYTVSYYIAGHRSRKRVSIRRDSDWGYLASKEYGHITGGENIKNWVYDSITFVAEERDTTIWFSIINTPEGTNSHFWVMDVCCVEGTKPSRFIPSLNDYSTTTQMNSAIIQKANEITQSVADTYTTKDEASRTYSTKSELAQTTTDFTFKLQNSGGYNVIRNGNALNGSAFWNPYWLPSASWGVRNDEWSGYVPCFQINNPAGSYHENCIYQNVPTTIGKTYTVSAMVAGHRGNNHISVVNGGGTYVICNSNNAWDRYGGSDAKDWTICTATFVAPESTTQIRLVCSPIAGTANNYGWFKEVQVEEGTQRTNYTPNPAEVYTGITRIDNEGVHVSHSLDGSTSHMGAHGFTHYVGGTNRKYHSLMVAGSVSTTDSWGQISMRITLPSEFRGKTFEVLPSLVHVGFDRDIAHAFKNLNISVHDFNHATGQFTLTCNPIGVDVVGAWAVNASTVRVSYIAIA